MDPEEDGGRNEGRREDGMVYVLHFTYPKGVREKGKKAWDMYLASNALMPN
jgi:hypothetical protein